MFLLTVIIFISCQGQSHGYRKFEKIFKDEVDIYARVDRIPIRYGHHLATDDNSFFFLTLLYNADRRMSDEINYTVSITTPTDPWSVKSFNADREICSSKVRTLRKNPVINKETMNHFNSLNERQWRKLYFSSLELSAAERLSRKKVIIVWLAKRLHVNPYSEEKELQVSDVNVTISIFDIEECAGEDLQFRAHLDFKSEDLKIVMYHNTFDVLTCGNKLCKAPGCIATYDFYGNQIGHTICTGGFLTDKQLIFPMPIIKSSVEDGFYALLYPRDNEQTKSLVRLSRDTSETRIICTKKFIEYQIAEIAASDSNGKYTVCQIQNAEIHCLQSKGTHVTMNLNLTPPGNVTHIAIHNSADDGFYLLTRQCIQWDCGEFKVMKIDEQGRLVGSFALPKSDLASEKYFQCNPDFIRTDFSEIGSSLCVHTACTDYNFDALFRVFCVPESKFH